MFWMRNKENNFPMRTLIWKPVFNMRKQQLEPKQDIYVVQQEGIGHPSSGKIKISLKSVRGLIHISNKEVSLGQVLPLFHTGHESPESPQIDFLLILGDSNRHVLRVSPDSYTISF